MSSNIILISENNEINTRLLKKLMLLRAKDCITVFSYADLKQFQNTERNIFILNTVGIQNSQILKNIKFISHNCANSKIIPIFEKTESKFLLECYDAGIYDYIYLNDESYTITLKLMNCLKLISAEETCEREQEYLAISGAIDVKTGLYNACYIETIYPSLITNKKYQNGVLVMVTLDESVKTKISSNRLALAIKKTIRKSDIAVIDQNGYFYLLLQDITIEDASNIVQKLQDTMTEEFQIKAGIVKTGIQDFEELLKNAKDSLNSAIIHNQQVMSLSDIEDNWLDEGEPAANNKKQYKLFKKLQENKIKYVIEPTFFKVQKELSKKLNSSSINQYTNPIESSFCIRSNNIQSELTIRFNGNSKVDTIITHSGLYSAENTKNTYLINKFNEKELTKLLKQLKEEFIQGFYQGEKTDVE